MCPGNPACSQCPQRPPRTSIPFLWSPSVTNGHKHVSDIPRHLLLDGVLHVVVGHLDKLLEDWPQEKPRRWGMSFSSESGGSSPLSHPGHAAGKGEGAAGMTAAQAYVHWAGLLWEGNSDLKAALGSEPTCVKSDTASEPQTSSTQAGVAKGAWVLAKALPRAH